MIELGDDPSIAKDVDTSEHCKQPPCVRENTQMVGHMALEALYP